MVLVASEFTSASSLFLSQCFRFHKNLTASIASASTSLLSMKQLIVFSVRKQASLLCKLFYLTGVVDRAQYGMEDNSSIFHTGSFLSFYSILKIFPSILKFSSIFYFYFPCQRNFRPEAKQRIFCCFASLLCCNQPLMKVRQQY